MQSVIVSLMMLTTVGATTVFGGKFGPLAVLSGWQVSEGGGAEHPPTWL